MANPEHVEIVKAGKEAIDRWREENPNDSLELGRVDLRRSKLSRTNLSGVNPSDAFLREVNLREANLSGTVLSDANLEWANLSEANLSEANLSEANLSEADLSEADLSEADLSEADLSEANVRGTDLSDANLSFANLMWSTLNGTNLEGAVFGGTGIFDVDLRSVIGLNAVEHKGPSSIGIDTLVLSRGEIPEGFLQGCGVPKWMQPISRLCDPAMTTFEICELVTTKLFDLRTEGPIHMGGVFLSYSHLDSGFVDRLYERMTGDGISVWLDKHNLNAGSIEKQVVRSLRIQDIVVVVLSKSSLCSDWVWHEIETAREKEQNEGRDVL